MEVNNFGLYYMEADDSQSERETQSIEELTNNLGELQALYDQRARIYASLESPFQDQETPQLWQNLRSVEAEITEATRSVTESITEATLHELLDFNEARNMLFTHAIPVTAEPKDEYDSILKQFARGTEIDLRERADQPKPERLRVDDAPTLYLAPERDELSMRAAIYLPITDEDGTKDSTIIYPRRERYTKKLTTPGIDRI